jgi:hypothetical protein
MPETFQALLVLAVAVLPGALYTWYFEREVGRWGATLSDRVSRFIGASAAFQALFAFPWYWLWTHYLHRAVVVAGQDQIHNLLLEGRPLPAWLFFLPVLYVALPIAVGTLAALAVRHKKRAVWIRHVARVVAGRDPAPRAWDYVFSESPAAVMRLRMNSGVRLGGLFGANSYAAGYPEQPQDLFIEKAYLVDQRDGTFLRDGTGSFRETGSGVLLRWDDVELLEVFKLEEVPNG